MKTTALMTLILGTASIVSWQFEKGLNYEAAAGYYLFFALLTWAVLFLSVFNKEMNLIIRVGMLPLIYGALVAGAWFKVEQNINADRQLKELKDEMVETITNSIEYQRTVSDAGVGKIEQVMPQTATKNTEWVLIESLMVQNSNAYAEITNQYDEDLELDGLPRILDPTWYKDGRAKRGLIVAQLASKSFEKYRIAVEKETEAYYEKIHNLDLQSDFYKGFIVGFDRSFLEYLDYEAQLLKLEKDTLDSITKIVLLLDRSQGDWYVENDQFMFNSGDRVEQYNSLFVGMNDLVAEQEQLMESYQKTRLEKLESARDQLLK